MSGTISETFLFTPTSTSGCQLWLDAADVNGNGTVPANGASVSTWVDKSGNGRNMAATTAGTGSVTYSLYKGGRSILFNSAGANTAYMRVVSAVNLTSLSVFAVSLCQTAVNNQNGLLAVPASGFEYGSTDAFGHFIDASTPQDRFYANGLANVVQNAVVSSGGDAFPLRISAFTCTSAGVLSSWGNGTAGQTSTGGARSGTATGFGIGFDINMPSGSPTNLTCVSQFSELIVYNAVLTQEDRQEIEGYLAWKWGLVGSLPANHPFKNYRPLANPPIPTLVPTMPLVTQNNQVFSPLQIPGCLMWMDARETSTLTTQSGVASLNTYVQPSPTTSTVSYTGTLNSLFALASGTASMNGSFINAAAKGTGFLTPSATIGDFFAFCYDLTLCKCVKIRFTLSAGTLSVTALGTGFGTNFLRTTNSPTENDTIFASYNTNIAIVTSADAAGYGVASFSLNFASVSQWNDRSQSGWNFTNATGATQPSYSAIGLNGLPALRFSETVGTFLSRTNTGTSALTTYTVFFVINQQYIPPDGTLSYFLDFQTGRLVFGNNNVAAQGVGTGLFNGAWATFPPIQTGIQILSYVCTAGGAMYRNGSFVGTFASFASIALNGAVGIGSHNNTTTFFYGGSMGEILIYNTAFTNAQRQQVEGYLAWKWNVSNLLATTQPYYNAPLAPFAYTISPFVGKLNSWQPTQISGLALWLDASDTATFNGGSTWTDKSGTNNNGTNGIPGISTMPSVTTWTNGLQAARFVAGSKNSVKTTNTIPDLCTQFIVLRLTASVAGDNYILTSSTANRIAYISGGTIFARGGASPGVATIANVGYLKVGEQGLVYTQVFGIAPNINGFRPYSNSVSPSRTLRTGETTTYTFGSGTGDAGYASIDIGEIIMYGSELTDDQRQQVEGYLAWKWNVIGNGIVNPFNIPTYINFPSSFPYIFFPPSPP